MKCLLSFPLLITTLSLSLSAGNAFEGNLTIKSDTNGTAAGKILLAVKNDWVAIDPGKQPQMVLNVTTGDFYTVVNQGGGQKIVAKLNVGVLGSLKEMPSFFGPFSDYMSSNAGEGEVKVTDETKVVNGFKCKKYIVKNGDAVSTIWAAQDFPFSLAGLMELMNVPGSSHPGLKASFPMEASMKDVQTNKTTGFTVSIEKKPLEQSLFTMPKDLLEMDMTNLVRQMIQTNDPAQIKKVLDSLIPR